MALSNNPPHVVLELDEELTEFVLENCDVNMAFVLNALQNVSTMSRETAMKLVELNEKFKKLRDLVLKSRSG